MVSSSSFWSCRSSRARAVSSSARRYGSDGGTGPVVERPLGLGHVQGPVGDSDQVVLGPAVVREAGNADADRDRRSGGRRRQVHHRPPDPLGDLVGGAPVGAGQDRRELVAAVAVQPVAVARGAGQGAGDPDQQGVAGGVATRIVEGLELVEVEHQHRERMAATARRHDLAELELE